ncbi:hypothetical protein [Xenorhabdus siamensis]|uniref:hypothetical protein n=1 Tax=Xenorhabdus siamensis TaxID=3136254 RepID=UPI0030F42CC5
MKRLLTVLFLLMPLASKAGTQTLVCGSDFIQIVDNNGLVEEVRVNNIPTNIATISHKINDNGDVDSFFVYGYKGTKEIVRLFHSGTTGRVIKQNFLFFPNGSPEKPGKPISKPILCK